MPALDLSYLRGGKNSWTYSQGTEEQEETLQKYLDIAQQKRLKPPNLESKPSLLSRFLGMTQAGETAPAVMKWLETGNLGEALKKQATTSGSRLLGQAPKEATYEDVLKKLGMKEEKIIGPITTTGLAGLAGDILLDPTTYFGGALLKKGAKTLKKGGGKALSKAPKLQKSLRGVKEGIEELFVPGAKIKRLPGKVGEEYWEKTFKPFAKGLRFEQRTGVEAKAKLAKEAREKFGKDIGEKLATSIETGKKVVGAEDLQEQLIKMFKGFAKEEKSRGLLKGELEKYVRHLLTPEAAEYLRGGGMISSEYFKPLRATLKAGKSRKLKGTIESLNKMFQAEHGANLFEPDVFKALAGRQVESLKAVRTYDFLNEVGEKFGRDAPEGITKMMADGMEFVQPKVTQLKGKLLPKPIAEHLDETQKILSNDEATKKLLKVYDKALGLWKGSVTGFFPAFHGRNFLGGTFNNYLAGVTNPMRYIEAGKMSGRSDDIIKLAGKNYTYRQLNEIMSKAGAIGEQGWLDVMGTVDDVTEKAFSQGAKKAYLSIKDAPKQAMNMVENRLRGALFIDQLAKGNTVDDAIKQVFKYHFDYAQEGLAPFERTVMKRVTPFYCVPTDSLILTKKGWLTVDDLSKKDLVLTYNKDRDLLEWKPVLDIAVFEYNQSIRKWSNKRHEIRFTHEHRWVVETKNRIAKRSYGTYSYSKKTEILPSTKLNSLHYLRVASRFFSNKTILTPAESSLLGWLLTDGYFRWRGKHCEAIIYQSPKKYLQKIVDLVGCKPRKPHPVTGVVAVPIGVDKLKPLKPYLKRSKSKDDWIDVVTLLSTESMESMYESMMDADGHRGNKQTSFACQLDGVARTFEVLATLLGKRVVRNSRGFYVSNIQTLGIKDGKFTDEKYIGRVWCPKTENGTWVMKQGKLITITGNTWTRNNIPLQLEQMVKQPGKYAGVGKTLRMISGATREEKEEYEALPEYMKRGFPMRIGEKEGLTQYLYGSSLPMEDLATLTGSGIMSKVSPILKVPVEVIANKNFYFDKPVTDFNKAPKLIQKSPQIIKDLLDYEEVKEGQRVYRTLNPIKWHILSSAFGRGFYTVDKLADPEVSLWIKALYGLLGIKGKAIDTEQQKYYSTKEKAETLGDWLFKKGAVRHQETYYQPK